VFLFQNKTISFQHLNAKIMTKIVKGSKHFRCPKHSNVGNWPSLNGYCCLVAELEYQHKADVRSIDHFIFIEKAKT
jgi:hypothetical protein